MFFMGFFIIIQTNKQTKKRKETITSQKLPIPLPR